MTMDVPLGSGEKPVFSLSEKLLAGANVAVNGYLAIRGAMGYTPLYMSKGLFDMSVHPFIAWIFVAFAIWLLALMTIPRFQSAERMSFWAGFTACGWAVTLAFVSLALSIGFGMLSTFLIQASRRIK